MKRSFMLSIILAFLGISFSPIVYGEFKVTQIQSQVVKIQQSVTEKGNFNWWRETQKLRQQKLDKYLKTHSKEVFWFKYFPLGYSGVPAIIFRLFGDVFPEIWGKNYAKILGLIEDKKSDHPIFPLGMSWGRGSKKLTRIPGLNKLRVMITNLTCAACHVGQVIGPKGKTHQLIGAPNTKFDVLRYRANLVKTLEDPRWNFQVFKKALAKKRRGWLYKQKKYIPQEMLDTKIFQTKGLQIMKAIKDKVTSETERIYGHLGPIYKLKGRYISKADNKNFYNSNKNNLLLGGTPGQLEAFGIATAKLAPWSGKPDLSLYGQMAYFGSGPALVDLMSVWNQNNRKYAQWDGNIRAKLIRNLGAELGVIGDPKLINMKNGLLTSALVSHLPSPPYLWEVDKIKADRGKKIFDKACLKCHGSQKFLPLAQIGTDENRAKGLPKKATIAGRETLKIACENGPKPECKASDEDILYPRWKNPGYQAQLLDGIWARSPYLHNGSVPTLYHMLIPSERPSKFWRGNLSFDTKKVGYNSLKKEDKYGTAIHNTNDSGRSNRGHEDINKFFGGIDFKKESGKREDLIEYLKTL